MSLQRCLRAHVIQCSDVGALFDRFTDRGAVQVFELAHPLGHLVDAVLDQRGEGGDLFGEGQVDGIVLAAAGLKRLGLEKRIRQWLEPDVMLPAAAQGALAIEICADRLDLLPVLAPLMHQPSYLQVCAERAVSQALGGSCAVPLAAYATSVGHAMQLQAAWGMPDGRMLRARAEEECATPQQAEQLGYAVAQQLIAQGATVEGLMQPDAG